MRNEIKNQELAAATTADDNDDGKNGDKTPRTRRRREQQSTMSEVSDPEEWAEVHYGARDAFDYERMVVF